MEKLAKRVTKKKKKGKESLKGESVGNHLEVYIL